MIKVALVVAGVFVPICLLAIPINESNIQSPPPSNLSDGVQPPQEPRNLNDFLEKCFKRPVLEYTIKPLTKFGDNFGSALQALEVKLGKTNDSSEIETLHLVVKAMLPGPVSVKESKKFLKEVHFYSNIVPTLQQFEASANIPETERIDAFARYFCSRLSLNPDASSVDSDASIVLENLKSINFESPDRWDRMDKDEMFAGLKKLAKIHALLIAMRHLQPDLFFTKVDPYLPNYSRVSFIEILFNKIEAFIKNAPTNLFRISPELRHSIDDLKTHFKNYFTNASRVPDTPYTTLYHADLWTKNFMTKKSNDATISIQLKLLDFQFCRYESFALDLMEFIFYNGRIDDLKTEFKSFINYYIAEFVKMLRLSNCPLDDYTNEKLWTEIKDKAKISLVRVYFRLGLDKTVLLGNSTKLTDFERVTDDFYDNLPTPEVLLQRWKCVTDLYIENELI